jgi:hypothetical protein
MSVDVGRARLVSRNVGASLLSKRVYVECLWAKVSQIIQEWCIQSIILLEEREQYKEMYKGLLYVPKTDGETWGVASPIRTISHNALIRPMHMTAIRLREPIESARKLGEIRPNMEAALSMASV